MERLFSPCTRLYDILESQGRRGFPELLRELNLNVSTEELLSAERAFTYADLFAMLVNRDTVAWLTPHAAVTRGVTVAYYWEQLGESCYFVFSADGKHIVASARSPEHLVEICNVVVRLLAASVVHSVYIQKSSGPQDMSISAPSLAYLMEQCQSLTFLSLQNLDVDEDHCRELGSFSRPGLEIELKHCKITSIGASALAETLGRNQGPTKLHRCEIDHLVLADGLRGNSRLKCLRPRLSDDLDVSNQEVFTIAGALRENKGLVELDLWQYEFRLSDETWGAICASLETHPTLEVLDFRGAFTISPAGLNSWVQALIDMLKVNVSIHTICLHDRYSENKLFRESVIPYLKTNRFRPRVRTIQKTRPIAYRAKVLGQALLATRTDVNRFWMILSGNVEVSFPSTTTPPANLQTPAAFVASSTANDADVAASVMPASMTNAASSLSTSTAAATTATSIGPNIATPSASQKRKVRP
jgi:hypothetical protein